MHNYSTHRSRRGFTLIELIVVIVIMGVISAVAAPKFFNRAGDAEDVAAKSSLATIRSAIEQYRAENSGDYPGELGTEVDFQTDLAAFLVGDFPTCPVGNKTATVEVETDGNALAVNGTKGWVYDATTGEFRINHATYIAY